MDFLPTGEVEDDEIGFDDNGLQHASMIASSELICETVTEVSDLPHGDAVPTGSGENVHTDIVTGAGKSHCTLPFDDERRQPLRVVLPKSVSVMNDEGSKQLIHTDQKDTRGKLDDRLDAPACIVTKNERAENVDDESIRRIDEAEVQKANIPSVLPSEDDGVFVLMPCPFSAFYRFSIPSMFSKKSRKAKAKVSKFWPERSAKDGDSVDRITDLKKQEKADNLDGRSTRSLDKATGKEAKFRSGRYAKDGGSLESTRDLEKQETTQHLEGRIRPTSSSGKEAQFRSKQSAKSGGCLESIACRKILSFIWTRACASLSWKLSVALTVGILLLTPSVGVDGGLTSVPVNTLVVVGNTVRINCSTDLNHPVYWARTLAGSDVLQWLYYGTDGFHSSNADGRFSIDKDETTGRYDIIIADVQPKDVGQYTCLDDSGLGHRFSAELVVSEGIKCNPLIPKDGVMGYNVFGLKQDFIEISCSTTYTGALSPTLKWSWPGSEVESIERSVSGTTSSVTSTLKLLPSKEHNNVMFQCEANIEGAPPHAKDSGLLWKSETVNVRYAVLTPNTLALCPGVETNLVCNPQCLYHFETKDHECRCQYTYYDMRTQQKYQLDSDPIVCGKEKKSSQGVLIAVTVISIVAFMTTVFAVICYMKKKYAKGQSSTESAESDTSSSDAKSTEPMLA